MRHARLTPNPHRNKGRGTTRVLTLALAALAALAIAPSADGAARAHRVKLDSTFFAAEIGSTPSGGTVYAGSVVDPKLHHGAIVYGASGATAVHVTFHEFFALGSIRGSGHVTVVPSTSGGQTTFTGSLTVTGGTGKYQQARGKLSVAGTINNTGMVKATVSGRFTY
jgi:hypothetical protein